jgi:membrane protease YdiL (CAAX protease family)
MSSDSSKSPEKHEKYESSDKSIARSRAWYAAIALLGTIFVFFGAQVMASILIAIYPGLRHWSSQTAADWLSTSNFANFFYIVIVEALTITGVWLLLRLFRWSWRTIGLLRPTFKQIGLGALALVPYFALYLLIVIIVSAIYPDLNVDGKQQIGFENVRTIIELLAAFVSLVILPPLVEEIVVRGFLYSGLKKAMPKIVAALVVSAVFGAAHLAGGQGGGLLWIAALDTFSLSLVLVYLREKTGNLWAGITLHALKNCIAFVSLFIIGVK